MKSKKNVEESALTSTLLPSTSFDEARGRHMSGEKGEARGRRVTNVDKNNPEMCQAYANNQPKIMLETINARTITIVFILTYAIGFLSFGFDLRNTIAGFKDGNVRLSESTCTSMNINPFSPPDIESYGCTFQNPTSDGVEEVWMGHASRFKNIISFSLELDFQNITGAYVNNTLVVDDDVVQDAYIPFNVKIYCCYENTGCGTVLFNGTRSDPNKWRLVLDRNSNLDFSLYEVGQDIFETNILDNTFQNQETLPDQGIIRSYHMYVTYHPGDGKAVDSYIVGEKSYLFQNTDIRAYRAARIMLNILFVVSIVIAVLYYRALRDTYGNVRVFALPEQRWQLFYMAAVIFFQNPFYCVIMWMEDPPVSVTYITYIIDALSQASFLTVWLLFSDGLRRSFDYWMFYVPKVAMGSFIALASCVIMTLQFPSINKYDDRSPVLAVEEWSYDLKITLVSFSLIFLISFWIWAIWWFFSLWDTGRQLQKLPYMSTRYLQLWFRFFSFQSILSSLYLIAQYGAVIYFIFHNSSPSANSSIEKVADNINTLFRQQTLAFGKVLFISVNSFVLAFFLLPAGYFDKSEFTSVTNLATTYVVSESEIGPIYKARKRAIRKLKLMNELFMDNPKAHVFCIDLAVELLELSWEAYNDVPGYPTISGYGFIEFDRVNYKLVNHAYDEQHDTVCYIVRHKVLPRVVICFRGTSSKQHWADNLNYTQMPIDLASLNIPDLDRVDGLGPATSSDIYANLRESDDVTSSKSFSNNDNEEDKGDRLTDDYDKDVDITINYSESQRGGEPYNERMYSDYSDNSDGSDDSWFSSGPYDDLDDDELGHGSNSRLSRTMSGIYNQAEKTINVTSGILQSAVKNAPILNTRYDTFVHTGFWDAYLTVRDFIHTTLRQELAQRPAHVMCTGHSLGGALATIACLDISLHTIPRVNAHLYRMREAKRKSAVSTNDVGGGTGPRDSEVYNGDMKAMKQKYIKTTVYTFGSPRIGNNGLATLLNLTIPDYFRVTVDGDVVTAVPKGGVFKNHYKHAGTEVVIDAIGAGSIIIDPSFIERRLRTQSKTSMSAHALGSYRIGVNGLKAAAEYMRSFAFEDIEGGEVPTHSERGTIDPEYIRRQVIIAKASAKAAQTTVAQMALRQTQQDQELQEQMKYEEEEKERQLGPIQLAAQTAQQRLSKMSHETIPRQDSSENDSDDFNCQKSESKSRITPFRSVSHSTRGKSVDELLANHGREMDTLVHSMASPPASQRVVDFGSSLAKVLIDLTTLNFEDKDHSKKPNESAFGGNRESTVHQSQLQPAVGRDSSLDGDYDDVPKGSKSQELRPTRTSETQHTDRGTMDATVVTIDL